MHIVDQKLLGILILILLGTLVVIKRSATGSILEKPKCGFLLWTVNIFNLFFLLIANPLAAILMNLEKMDIIDPSRLIIANRLVLLFIEIAGLIIYVSGFILMAWALTILGMNYQLGGVDPRATDNMVVNGPYRYIRHPMYTAALCIALGLSFLIQSIGCFITFCIYLVLIIFLIQEEEKSLIRAYGETYLAYRRDVRMLIPFLY